MPIGVESKTVVKTRDLAGSRFMAACRLAIPDATPVWFMRQAGRYLPEYRRIREKHDLLSICKTPELAAEVTLQPVEILGVDAAIIFADLLLPFEPMGIRIHFAKGEGPVIENPIQRLEDVKNLQSVNPEESLDFVLTAIRMTREALKRDVPLIGFAGAPFTLASYLIEGGHSQTFLKTKRFMHEEPDSWNALMTKISETVADFLKAQIKTGAAAVQLFDSWAGILSPRDYARYALPHSSSIIREVAGLGAPIIHFATGHSGMLEVFRKAGGDVTGIDWRTPLSQAWKQIGYDRGIQGNLDPAALFAPPGFLKEEVENILRQAERRPGHIFNLGHGILPGTPVDNVKRVVEWVKSYNHREEA